MKKLSIAVVLLVLIFFISCTKKEVVSVEWSVEGTPSTPESVYFDKASNTLFVSNIVGEGGKKDGEGWISKVTPKGEIILEKWVELDAPTGMRSKDGILWVANVDEVVSIDLKSGEILKRFGFEGAKFLNDVAIGDDGVVYVSDTKNSLIYQIKDGEGSIFMQGDQLESPNGLLFKDGRLYVAAWGKGLKGDWSVETPGRLYWIDPQTKKIHYITKGPLGNLDGIEIDKDGNFIVSDWIAGKIFKVDKSGKSKLIYSGEKGFADIAFVPSLNIVVIPEMLKNKLTAIKLNR